MEIDQVSAKRKIEYSHDSVNESLLVENIVGRVSRSYLQKIFSSYGSVECKFLNKKTSGTFAVVEFDQVEDAIRAIGAANKNKIILNDEILKVSFDLTHKRKRRKLNNYLNDDTLIHRLNEDCMKKIFSYLNVDERLILDEVCTRWMDISATSWSDIKTFSWNEIK
ncbi:hypothetical protein HCN44_001627 [Aphidius gifuensis]|uniref:RRM domain-containing protein n=1 Tax=Aphidius gifuensis TaxID=684658 RepID=A0A834XVD1_APHGI|nr:hypothetical protein HCN44_001627 [Aphidius gifuensis]